MSKNEICQRLVDVCNSLNTLTVTGVQNASCVIGCYNTVQEIAAYLLSCEVVPHDKKRDAKKDGGE